MTKPYTFNKFTIEIDPNRNDLLTSTGKAVLDDGYLMPDEDYQQAFARAACTYADSQPHAQRMYDYASQLWFMFATPVLANAGNPRGLPVSCFLQYVDDSVEGLIDVASEASWLSVRGGGIAAHYGDVRSVGEITTHGNETPGVIPFIKTYDTIIGAYKQGKTRRGAGAVYMQVNHPEIVTFLNFRRDDRAPDPNRFMSFLHHGINITDDFMEAVTKGADWPLIDPHSGKVKNVLDARMLWKEILATRLFNGEPYLHFVDTANRYLPDALKMKGLKIHGSNLCSEIELPTNKDRTAVCVLSSINLERYEEWKNEPLFVEDLIRMLDNVIEDFIRRAPPAMHKAVKSAMGERSVGLGTMGWHYLLQSKGIPFESVMAISWLKKIHGIIWGEANAATALLAKEKGEAYDMIGTGKRNAHLIAIAPNANSADICGETSPSIEPLMTNIFEKSNKSGDYMVYNKYLQKLLQKLGKDTFEVWQSINIHGGSVQHLDFLDELNKAVFKTAMEIDQMWIIQQAGERQKFIDQGQSVNLFFNPETVDFKDVLKTHKAAWSLGLKALYYLRTKAAGTVDALGTGTEGNTDANLLDNNIKIEYQETTTADDDEVCLSCQG